MAISYYTEQTEFKFKGKLKTKQWIKSTITEEGGIVGDIQIVFCDNDYILKVNREFLQHDYFTDVITFDNCEGRGEKRLISGDIIISIDTVADNAEEYGDCFENELKRVIIHGVLHLLGYPDKKPDEATIMRGKENLYLSKYI